ncbi:MAG: DUF11 domain-containing protein [Deltaproteobacteria bacterium]|nr:DUF11 domain-containing protein [Deltaproteobacteria bacterium]
MKRWIAFLAASAAVTTSAAASADTFAPGTLVVPMDTTYQDQGMLRAFGLVYKLLSQNIPVRWVIRNGKAYQGVDFTTSAVDLQTNAAINNHGYRGGPWVIDQANAAKATPIIVAYQSANPMVKVHRTTAAFTGDVSRLLVAAPTIGMHADGNEDIAVSYLVAAGIPDSTGNYTWPNTSPDMLTPAEVAGPTTTSHKDGKLFDANGTPTYCQFMSMHWGVNNAIASPETVAEVRAFLGNPVHFFAECQAVNAFENLVPHGFFLTTTGFLIGAKPTTVDFLHADQPFGQIDGPFLTVGGSEPSYSIPPGGAYKNGEVVMITEHGTPVGIRDLWMTGYLDGVCPPDAEVCGSLGKVSYLGGHKYEVKTPISANPNSQGTRLFLNSLFEAPCATAGGQPSIGFQKTAPASTATNTVTFQLSYMNSGPAVALAATIDDPIPAGSTFVSATNGGTFSAGAVHWSLGNLGVGAGGTLSFTVTLPSYGDYLNTASLKYKVGVTPMVRASNTTHTQYAKDTDGDGVVDPLDICPLNYNPDQDLQTDPQSCGSCGTVCSFPHATPACTQGVCTVAWCAPGWSDCDGQKTNGCEYDSNGLLTDPNNCGSCGNKCVYPEATAVCNAGTCGLGTCNPGFSNCNGLPADGCEYANSGLQSDPANCGTCGHVCLSGFVCLAGACAVDTCPTGFSDCDGISANGCEYANAGFATDVNHCGSCTTVCATPHATPVCNAGSCGVGTCNAGYSDCNGVAVDGCEFDNAGFASDPNHCGGCSTVCAFQHADGACVSGACAISVCQQGFSNCNGVAADGCEYDDTGFATDVNHCGGCATPCAPVNGVGACVASVCTVASCATGFWNLDGDAANGCEYACTKASATDTTCNGIDDDCNGIKDDGYVPVTCGQGACQANAVCQGGVETCTPGAPAQEGPEGDPTCADNADNDCNGSADLADPACQSEGGLPDAALDGDLDAIGPDAEQDATQDTSAQDTSVPDVTQDQVVADVAKDNASDGPKQDAKPGDGAAGTGQDAAAHLDAQLQDGAAGSDQAPASSDDGGCACRTSQSDRGAWGGWAALLAFGTLLAARRSRRRSPHGAPSVLP